MNKIERKVLIWIEGHLLLILLFAATLLGLIIRFALKDFVSNDFIWYLQPWYQEIAENGINEQVGNYNLLYQMVIWVLTRLSIEALYAYKIFSCIFDLLLALAAAAIVGIKVEGKRKEKALLTYSAVWLSPLVFLNSAAWAQCDAIYVFFCLFALLALDGRKYKSAFCLLGLAFAFKLQAVFLLPLFFFVYFLRREFSLLHFLLIPVIMMAVSSPALLWGRSLTEVFTIYANQTDTYQAISMNYPSVWILLCNSVDASAYSYMKMPAICMTVFLLALLMYYWLQKGYKAEGKSLYSMAYLLIYTCVLFLPAMHDRYGFLYEILAIVLAMMIPRMIPLSIGLICIGLNTYGAYLFENTENLMLLSCLNLAIYLVSILLLGGEMAADTKERKEGLHER